MKCHDIPKCLICGLHVFEDEDGDWWHMDPRDDRPHRAVAGVKAPTTLAEKMAKLRAKR